MKSTLSLFISLFSILIFGQNQIQITGTKYSMIPPKGFMLSTNFTGFQNNETGASIIVADLPASYSELVKGFTKEALKTKGMELISKDNVKYNNSEATLYKVSQKANGLTYLKQILVYGNSAKTVMVNGIYPEQSKEYENEIITSLYSLKYDDKQIENPLESAKFSIDINGTDYIFVKSLAGSLLYSEDGQIPSSKGLIIVANSLGNKVSSDSKIYSIERLKKLPNADNSTVKSIDKLKIYNLDGYETVAEGNNKQLIYQTILFTENNEYYLIVGETKVNKDKNLEIFKKVARTFKLK